MSTQKIDMTKAKIGQRVKLRRGDFGRVVINPHSTLFLTASAIVATERAGYAYGVNNEGFRTMEAKIAAGETAACESFDYDVVEILPLDESQRPEGLIEKLATAIKEGERKGETAMETAARQTLIITAHFQNMSNEIFGDTTEDHA